MSQSLKNFFFVFIALLVLLGCKNDDTSEVVEDPTAQNKKALGTSAEDILSDDSYGALTVELVYTESSRPSQESINGFRNFITSRVHKPNGIFFIENQVPDQSGAPFTLDNIRSFEEEFRTQYTEGNTIAVYLFFSNGSSSNDTQTNVTLGTAYRNTSIVVYQNTLKIVTNSDPISLPILEQTVMEHEFGHILGLVNIQNDDTHTAHEDPSASKHCIVEDCLMYFEATNFAREEITRFLSRGAVPQLDPLCIEDLQAKGGK
ncbi:MAG: membrane metalloprotease [Flavobacteriaceae bacterium]